MEQAFLCTTDTNAAIAVKHVTLMASGLSSHAKLAILLRPVFVAATAVAKAALDAKPAFATFLQKAT